MRRIPFPRNITGNLSVDPLENPRARKATVTEVNERRIRRGLFEKHRAVSVGMKTSRLISATVRDNDRDRGAAASAAFRDTRRSSPGIWKIVDADDAG